MESVYLFGFDNDIQTFHRDEEIKEKEKIVLNYANNNNKEIKLNHVNNIFYFGDKITNLCKFRFFMKLLTNFKQESDNFIMINDLN